MAEYMKLAQQEQDDELQKQSNREATDAREASKWKRTEIYKLQSVK